MNFKNKFFEYNKNAIVQKRVALNLTKFIEKYKHEKKIDSVLEIGCGTGIFTRYFLNSFSIRRLVLNDFYNTEEYLKDISYETFIENNIEKINFFKYELIISSSTLQWINNFEKLIEKISRSCNEFFFSIYLQGNLIEVKEHFKISLSYFSFEDIQKILKKYFSEIKSYKETERINFDSPVDALKHLKNTGVTGFSKASVSQIKKFKSNKLTYEVGYFYCKS